MISNKTAPRSETVLTCTQPCFGCENAPPGSAQKKKKYWFFRHWVMKLKKSKIGFFTSLTFYDVFHILYLIVLKINWREDNFLKYFMPIWTFVMFVVGVGLADKYYNKKNEYYPEPLPDNFNSDKEYSLSNSNFI